MGEARGGRRGGGERKQPPSRFSIMKKRTYILPGIVALIVSGIMFGLGQRNGEPEPTSAAAIRSEPARPADSSDSRGHPTPATTIPIPTDDVTERPQSVTAQTNDRTFRVNDSARLILDEQTRLNMEALFARTDRDRLAEAKQQAIEPLPAAAAAQAAELLEQYDNYQQAHRQAYPPSVEPATEEAALAELDGLHALRAAHFGPIVARALYGEEEAVSRQLIELMRRKKDQSLTLQEKAGRAQQLRDSMPELAEIERRNSADPH